MLILSLYPIQNCRHVRAVRQRLRHLHPQGARVPRPWSNGHLWTLPPGNYKDNQKCDLR